VSHFIKQQNGELGESRSRSLLLEDFWVLTRSVDADAADLIVQDKFETHEEIREARGQPMRIATVQAKFFEGSNQVRISVDYVVDADTQPRKGFLALLHTRDEKRKPVHYLFNAREIVDHWHKTDDKLHYYFSLTRTRAYEEFRNLDPDPLRDKVKAAIAEGSLQTMRSAWNQAANLYSSVRPPSCTNPIYELKKIGRAAIAIVDGQGLQLAHPLEPRKDVYPYFGTYDWGYEGEGPRLLAASILTHFLCGRRPERSEINRLVGWLLERVPTTNGVKFGKEEIIKALALIPYFANLEDDREAVHRPQYESASRKYASYFSDPNALAVPWSMTLPDEEEDVTEAPAAPK